MGQHCVYIWHDPKDGVPRYVGKGKNVRRARSHLLPSARPTRTAKMLRKRMREGFLPEPRIILASSDTDAKEMEVLLIALIGREDLGLGPLFNLTDGGDGSAGHRQTEATRRKRSVSMLNMSPEARANMKRGNSNRPPETYAKGISTKKQRGSLPRSPECCAKISVKQKGRIKSDQHLSALAAARAARTEERRKQIVHNIAKAASKRWLMEYEDGRPSTTILNLNQWCKDNPEYNFSSTRRTSHHGRFYKGVRVHIIASC